MKKLHKTLCCLVALVVAFAGCTSVEVDDLSMNISGEEEGGAFRVAVTTQSNSGTKVNVDGLTITWSESDVIKIVTIGESDLFSVDYTYVIDKESISEDGKSAEFTGENLVEGESYIAYLYPHSGYVGSSSYYGITNNFFCDYDYSDFDTDNIGLVMQSNIFEYDGESLPQLYFEHKSSLLEVDIVLDGESEYIGEVRSIEISASSGDVVFMTTAIFNTLGESVYAFSAGDDAEQCGASSSIVIELAEPIEFSASAPVSLQIPLTWNGYITEVEGDFNFTIMTVDSVECMVTKPMRILEDGVRYSAELLFEVPVDLVACDRAALVELYNALGGDGWSSSTNWCTDADLSNWFGVYTDSLSGRVVKLVMDGNNLIGEIPESIGNLTNLTSLNLSGVNLTGSIPESIGNLTELERLTISGAAIDLDAECGLGQMEGEIPDMFGGMTNLTSLEISNARFSGAIPSSIGGLSNLERLNLSYNQLEGSVDMLKGLTNLEVFSVECNNLSGEISSEWSENPQWNYMSWRVLDQHDGYGFTTFPDIYVERSILTTIEGESLDTDEFFSNNELTCVLYWQSTCSWSTEYLDVLTDLCNLYADKGFNLIAISDESSLSTITNYVEENDILGQVCQIIGGDDADNDYSNYADGTNRVKYMTTQSTPTYVIVDSEGKILFSESIYPFEDPTTSREEATRAFVLDCLGEPTVDDSELIDYTADGDVITLQLASVGSGINVVILGDGFIDTDMGSGGVYQTRMSEAMEHLFSEEPYATYRDRFNVYTVNAISENDGVDGVGETAFSCEFGDGTLISGEHTTVLEYAIKVPEITTLNDLLVIVVLKSSNYAGTCYMYTNDAAIAYCPIVFDDDEYFRQIITHEAGGHGFAKLLDEYSYSGTITDSDISNFEMYKSLGWGTNVDVTSDSSLIQWSQLLSDSRYNGLIGIYEGALTYARGAYRPTDVSIMRYNTGGYNPPSREEIYRRIMELSGDTYDYESFVSYDAINRSISVKTYSASVDQSTFVPLAEPVIIFDSPRVSK